MWNCFALHQTDHYQQANFMQISKKCFPKVQKMTLTFFFSMFCSLSGISLSWKTLVFGRFTSQERTNVHRTAFFLHTPDFSLSKVTALKVVWGKDTSRRSKEPGSDLPSCFSAWAPFCKCGWRHHIFRSGCGPDWQGSIHSRFQFDLHMSALIKTFSVSRIVYSKPQEKI